MNKENKKKIEEVVLEVIKLMGFECEVEILEDKEDDSRVICNIKTTKEANLLIGQSGDNLQALQHIVRLLVRKETEDIIKFVLDINSYKKEQEFSILDLAKEMAKQAIDERKTVVMRPMSAYNRRLVHMYLADNSEVITESVGEEGERRIAIKPRP
jgi:spoIIIJ-associated protein